MIYLSETTGPISIYHCRNVSYVTLYHDCSSSLDSSKNIAARGRGLFCQYIYIKIVQAVIIRQKTWPLGGYIYIENFKNLLVRNSWTEFNVTWQEYCFSDLLPNCSSCHDTSKNMVPRGRGLFSICICIENFRVLLVKYPLTNFSIAWLECCFGDPPPRLF